MTIKKTKGKQKIEMKKVENIRNRHAIFSRRKSGIYKKANELTTVCGADVGVLMFSTSGKPFSFGNPSFEEMAKRFLAQNFNNGNESLACPLQDADWTTRIDNLLKTYNDLLDELESEKEREQSIKKCLLTEGNCQYRGWWNTPIEELNLEEVNKTLKSFEDLHDQLCNLVIEKRKSASSRLAPSMDLNLPPVTSPSTGNGNEAASSLSLDGNDDQ